MMLSKFPSSKEYIEVLPGLRQRIGCNISDLTNTKDNKMTSGPAQGYNDNLL